MALLLARARASLVALFLVACASSAPTATQTAPSSAPAPSAPIDAGSRSALPISVDAADASSSQAAVDATPDISGCDQPNAKAALPKSTPDCARVVRHAITVSRVRENMGARIRGQADKQWLDKWIADETKRQVAYCESRPWPDPLRRCLLAAQDGVAIHRCEEEDFVQSPVRACCERVAVHQVRLMSKALEGDTKGAEMFASIKDTHEGQLRRACANVWSPAERKCVLGSRTADEAKACLSTRTP